MLEKLPHLDQKDWWLLALGWLVAQISPFGAVRDYISNRTKFKALFGKWYTYHWSRTTEAPTFRETVFDFKRSWVKLKVVIIDNEPGLKYEGACTFEAGYVVIHFRATGHYDETLTVRLTSPIPSEGAKMIGIMLFQDFDRKNVATIKLCSRKKLEHSDAKSAIARYAYFVSQESALRIMNQRER